MCNLLENNYSLQLLNMASEPSYVPSCAMCKLVFDSVTDVRVHEWHQHHGSPSTKCEACITGFTTKEELMNHVKIHYLYCCNFCSLNTNSWIYYKEHVHEHCKATPYVLTGMIDINSKQDSKDHFMLPYVWKPAGENIVTKAEPHIVISKTFSSQAASKSHRYNHTGKKPHLCQVCKKGFGQAWAMRQHMKIHTGEKPHLCPVCKKGFSHSGHVKQHMRVHTGEKPHHCTVCKSNFSRSSDLKQHMKIHTGEKPHVCKVCKQSFSRLWVLKRHNVRAHKSGLSDDSDLKQHMEIDTEEKPHICHVCKKGFGEAWRMKQHMKTHTGEKPHVCTVCKKSFSRLWVLKRHNLKAHNLKTDDIKKEFNCDICSEAFITQDELTTHLTVHDREKPHFSSEVADNDFEMGPSIVKQETSEETHISNEIMAPCESTMTPEQPGSVGQHDEGHSDKDLDSCQTCDFASLKDLEGHKCLSRNEEEDLFPCSECDNIYTTYEKLLNHVTVQHDKTDGVF